MKTAIYFEDGWKARVEILQDNSDSEWEKYQLKVIETLEDSAIFDTPPDGDVFEVSNKRNCGFYCWDLELIDAEPEDVKEGE